MAVGLIIDFEGATLEQYEKVNELMGTTGGLPEGGVFHWAAATDDGLRVVDVWESREAFDKFAEEKIGPASAEAGIQGPPQISEYQVHNILR